MFYYYLRGYPYFAIMTVSIDQGCAGIGLFYGKFYVSIKVFNTNICLSLACINLFSLVYCSYLFFFLLLRCNRDVESNSGPKKNKEFSVSCCYWNVNSLLAHDCAKVSAQEAYNSVFKYDFICISETCPDSTISSDNNNLNISGYNLIRVDHPSNSKRGSVCIYTSKLQILILISQRSLVILMLDHINGGQKTYCQ